MVFLTVSNCAERYRGVRPSGRLARPIGVGLRSPTVVACFLCLVVSSGCNFGSYFQFRQCVFGAFFHFLPFSYFTRLGFIQNGTERGVCGRPQGEERNGTGIISQERNGGTGGTLDFY